VSKYLGETLGDKASFEARDLSVLLAFDVEDPFRFHSLPARRQTGDFLVHFLSFKSLKLLMHCCEPFIPILQTLCVSHCWWVALLVVGEVGEAVEHEIGGKDMLYNFVGGEWAIRK
jgi:hypothetical protein